MSLKYKPREIWTLQLSHDYDRVLMLGVGITKIHLAKTSSGIRTWGEPNRIHVHQDPEKDPKNGTSQQSPSFPNVVMGVILEGSIFVDPLRDLGS